MDWMTGIVTIFQMHLLARGFWAGWLVGLVNQTLWLTLIYERKLWGLLPLSLVLSVQYAWALRRWQQNPPGTAPRRIVLDLDRLDYDAVQNAIAKQMVAIGFPPERDPQYGQSNAAGEALAEICRAWDELRQWKGRA